MINILPLSVGQRFSMSGVEFEIAFHDTNLIRYSGIAGGKIYQLPMGKFQKLLEGGALSLVGKKPSKQTLPHMLSKKDVSIMNCRLLYVREVLKHVNHPTSKRKESAVRAIVEKVSKENSIAKSPSHSTIARWIKLFISSNQDPISLAPMTKNKGNRTLRFDPNIEAIIDKQVQANYLSKQRLSSAAIHTLVVIEILAEYADKENNLPDHIKLPSKRSIRSRIANLDPYKRSKGRDGK